MSVGLVTIVGLLVLSICGVPIFLALGTATLAAWLSPSSRRHR